MTDESSNELNTEPLAAWQNQAGADKEKTVLLTQCLQNDFTGQLDRFSALPNRLHVGYGESLRLLGEDISRGPVFSFMRWAYEQNNLHLLHIRDWHDQSRPEQADHLRQFGAHCLKDTAGAEFVFAECITDEKRHIIIDASGLNDFVDTTLQTELDRLSEEDSRAGWRFGIAGVWTEAKVTFLAYDLRTRYPESRIAVCSALCASSSRQMHFVALEQLQSVLGVEVYDSVSDFGAFLSGQNVVIEPALNRRADTSILYKPKSLTLSDDDEQLLLYLFRECTAVELSVLDGGFSGNLVLKAHGRDIYGHRQVPHVVKIGERSAIAAERRSFEQVQEILGNSAPSVVDFGEAGKRGAIKYRYAAMTLKEGRPTSFQKLYASVLESLPFSVSRMPPEQVEREYLSELYDIIDTVFVEQLGRFYQAGDKEKCDLLEYYDFSSRYAENIRSRIWQLTGDDCTGERVAVAEGLYCQNPVPFYRERIDGLLGTEIRSHYFSYVHGDLNGANIVIDDSSNVWLIDFFHTHRGHLLKDLIKLENDILYIFTPVENEAQLQAAARLSHLLYDSDDLTRVGSLPPVEEVDSPAAWPAMVMAWLVIRKLRSIAASYIRSDRHPWQLWTGVVRYAMHTLSFDEPDKMQRRFALYSGALCISHIELFLELKNSLRFDFIPLEQAPESLALTILPGRRDRGRDLVNDVQLIAGRFDAVVCLLTENEFSLYGVEALKDAYRHHNLAAYYHGIVDQSIPLNEDLEQCLEEIHAHISAGERVLLHCVGGLGRSGLVAACYLCRYCGYEAADAIEYVRRHRSRRAIETSQQEDFIFDYCEARSL